MLRALVSRQSIPYWVIFTAALAVRLAHFTYMRANDPLFDVLMRGADNYNYQRWAGEIAQTFWLGWDRVPFTQGPLYPYFLGLVFIRFGTSYGAAVVCQHVLGAGACVLLFALGRRVFGRAAGRVAGAMAIFCPLFLLFEGELLAETLSVFVNVAALCMLVWAADGEKRRRWFYGGLLLGLSALARPNMLLFLPVAGFWVAAARGWRRQAVAPVALVMAGAALAIAPATLTNYFAGGKFALVSTNAAWNLYIGNAHDAWGVYVRPASMWDIVFKEDKNEAVIDWTPYLLESIRAHPTAMPRLLLRKTRFFWQSAEIPHIVNFYLKRPFSPFLRSPLVFGVVAPLGLVGLVTVFLRRSHRVAGGPAALLALFLATYSASIIMVFVLARFRLPALAVLILFAAAALSEAGKALLRAHAQLRARAYPPAARAAAVAAAILVAWGGLGWALHTRDPNMRIRWCDHYNLAGGYEIKGRYEDALREYDAAIRVAPYLRDKLEPARTDLLERMAIMNSRSEPAAPAP